MAVNFLEQKPGKYTHEHAHTQTHIYLALLIVGVS